MSGGSPADEGPVGYRRPPAATRFAKGRSGNPKGRPRGKAGPLPYESVLGQIVTAAEGGQTKRITAAEAFLLKLMKDALSGDSAAIQELLSTIESAKSTRTDPDRPATRQVIFSFVRPGSVATALEHLRMGKKLDRFRDTARVLLEPWIVEAALDRRGDEPLSVEEQRTVMAATRTPWRVKWPEWWCEAGRCPL